MFAGRIGVAKRGECCAEWSCRALRRAGRTPLTFSFMQPVAFGPVRVRRKRGRPRRYFRWEGAAA